MTRDEYDDRLVLKSHQLMKCRNYKVRIVVGASGFCKTRWLFEIRTQALASLMMNLPGPVSAVYKSRYGKALAFGSRHLTEVRSLISHNLQMKQLKKKVRFSVMHAFAKNFFQQTSFICNNSEKIISKSMLITTVVSSPVIIIKPTQERLNMTVNDVDQQTPHSDDDTEGLCTVALESTFDSVSETLSNPKTSAVCIHLVETHKNLIKRIKALVTYRIKERPLQFCSQLKLIICRSRTHISEVILPLREASIAIKVKKCFIFSNTAHCSEHKNAQEKRLVVKKYRGHRVTTISDNCIEVVVVFAPLSCLPQICSKICKARLSAEQETEKT